MTSHSVIKVADARHARCASVMMEDITEVISFDIFDTLIYRSVFTPKDIFTRVSLNGALQSSKFAKKFPELRSRAERGLRIREREAGIKKDPTLDAIYAELKSISGVHTNTLNKFKKIEIEEELESVSPRLAVKQLFDFALTLNKKVILCSDMYLPRATIEAMLEKCGYAGYDELYLSCDLGVTKKHGTIFGFIERDLGVDSEHFIHFGDNAKSDVRGAEDAGWRAMKVATMQELFLSKPKALDGLFPSFRNEGDVKSNATRQNYALIWERLFKSSTGEPNKDSNVGTAEAFGYTALGPFLLSLTLWIIRESSMRGIEKIAFLARDGHLPIKAAKILVPALGVKLKLDYLEISRRAIFPYFLHTPSGIEFILGIRYDPRQTIGNFLDKRFGAAGLALFERDSKGKPGLSSDALMVDHHQYIEELMRAGIDTLKRDSQAAYDNLVDAYRARLAKDENVAIFDVGRKGTFQSVLTDITQARLHGLYVVTDHAIQANAPKRSFSSFLGMMDGRVHAKVPDTVLYEAFLSERGGSFLGFGESGEALRDVLEDSKEQSKFFEDLHRGALQFVSDAVEKHGRDIDDLEQEPFYAAYALENWNKNESVVALLGDVAHDDAVSIPGGKSLGDYFVSPRRPQSDLIFPPKSSRKRIAIYAPALTRIKGGAERIAARLANHMSGENFEVLVFTSGNPKASRTPVYPLEPGIIVRNVDVRDVERIEELIAAYEPDAGLVLASGPPVARIALAFVRSEVPFLLSERASPMHSIETYWTDFAAEDYFGVYESASLASVQFDSFREMFPQRMHSRVAVLPNPIKPVAKRSAKREKLILCAARIWFEQKRQDVLLEAFARIAKKFPDWKLAFYGASYGEDRKMLERAAKEKSISDRVLISDPIEDIEKEMERAAIFVLPSAFEGFPNALAEALAVGTPSIGFSECPGTNELIADGVNGRLVDDSDLISVTNMDASKNTRTNELIKHQRVERLAKVLEEMMGDASLRGEMSKAAFDYMKPYAESEMNQLWRASLDTLLGKDGALFKQQRESFLTRLISEPKKTPEKRPNSRTQNSNTSKSRVTRQTDAEFQAERASAIEVLRRSPLDFRTRLKLLVRTKKLSLSDVTDGEVIQFCLAPSGRATLRPAKSFDDDAYLSMYPDVEHAMQNGEIQNGYVHYITHGFYEGRSRPSRP